MVKQMSILDILPFFNQCHLIDNGTLPTYYIRNDHQLIIDGQFYNHMVKLPNGAYELHANDMQLVINSDVDPIYNGVVIKVTRLVVASS
jgi:hypothetical protein